MTTPKRYTQYPAGFIQITKRVNEEGTTARTKLIEAKEVHSMWAKFNGFRKALHDAVDKGKFDSPEEMEYVKSLASQADRVVVRKQIEKDKKTGRLEFVFRDNMRDAQILDQVEFEDAPST